MKIKALLIFIVLTSCNPTKSIRLNDEGDMNDAITNTIIDFSKLPKSKDHNYYNIVKRENSNSLYCFAYIYDNLYYVDKREKIGSRSEYFPTRYIELNGKLYFWADSTEIISKQVVDKLYQYKVIDSTEFKIEAGILPKDSIVTIYTDELREYTKYFVCKNKISKLTKIHSSKTPIPSKYPEINCDD